MRKIILDFRQDLIIIITAILNLTIYTWLKDSKDESVIIRTINTSVVKVMSSKLPYRVRKICKNNTSLCTVNLNYYLFLVRKRPNEKMSSTSLVLYC